MPPTLIHPASQQGGRGEVEKLDRRSQGGDGGEMGEGGIFGARKGKGSNLTNFKFVIWSISAFSGREGLLARSQGLYIFSRLPRIAPPDC